MPHVVYFALAILCPWPNCGFRIEMVDFQLEMGDQTLYSQVMLSWGSQNDSGLIARCPGCGQYVRFSVSEKSVADDPGSSSLPVLPDDWHLHAYIVG
jgi:hypothetical protein